MNVANITGNIVRDARVNALPVQEGKEPRSAINFTVAVDAGYMKDDVWVDAVDYIDVVEFRQSKYADKRAEGLSKGRFVEVEGSIRFSEPKEGKGEHAGTKFVNMFIEANRVKAGAKPRAKEDGAAE